MEKSILSKNPKAILIRLDEDLHYKFKIACARNKKSMQNVIKSLIELMIEGKNEY